MAQILINDIIPILVIMLLGYLCGKFGFFNDSQRQGFNKLVLNIALPAALFVSIVKATRTIFAKDIVLTLISVFGITALFMVSYFLDKWIFHRSMQEAAVCALIAGSPTIGFLGFAVLDPIYGNNVNTNLVIGIVSIVVNAITIPIGLSMVSKGVAKSKREAKANGTALPDTDGDLSKADESTWQAIINAVKQPVAAAPLIAVILVLIGVRWPAYLDPSFNLVAKANSGVAVLAAGLALSTVKFGITIETIWNTFYRLIVMPAIIVLLCYIFGMGKMPEQISMLCLAAGLPPAFSGIIISSRYNIYVKEGANTVAVSTVCFAASCIFWIWILPILPHLF